MEFTLTATHRNKSGTSASRYLRRSGQIPAVIYGNDQPASAIALDHKEIYYALKNEAFHSSVISMTLDDKTESVIVRQFQMHPFKPQLQHIDFQRVDLKKAMQLKIALHFINEDISPAVKLQGHRVTHLFNEVEMRALPSKMPTFIEVDLAQINAGEVVRLSDLVVPEGTELVDLLRGDDTIIASTTNKSSMTEEIEATATDTAATAETVKSDDKADN
ncbi:MAG: 50S ribosomal protein L25/general stress protein Ctc [Neisseriales bacterium]|nr:MAG: 50S ribosomal protein L25/general stress protein Ctc [Neisseriales bacterium]